MTTVKYPIALIATFLWVGFVCAISFMEAWLKFRAPGVTLSTGLSIGRHVFKALNKVEWVFAMAIIANLLMVKACFFPFHILLYFIPLLFLIIQTFWLLPALDARVELHLGSQAIPPSNTFFYNVGMEVLNVICLIAFGVSLFK